MNDLTMESSTWTAQATLGAARSGILHTKDGNVETPAFMPVATRGAIRTLSIGELPGLSVQIMLCNAFHLDLRPGRDIVRTLGGLQKFVGFKGPILTDSGGFQVFSLSKYRKLDDDGVTFRSPLDGAKLRLTPEDSVLQQRTLGSTIAMVLDDCPALPATKRRLRASVERTVNWAKRARAADAGEMQLFGIVQGGLDPHMRRECAKAIGDMGFEGHAIGGLSVGESQTDMLRVLEGVAPVVPAHKVRYLMGVGTPHDLLEAIARGIDLFDCVLPTRNARNGRAFTDEGSLNLRNARFRGQDTPLSDTCECETCRNHSTGYLHHLITCKEAMGGALLVRHNLAYYQTLMKRARAGIRDGTFHARLVESKQLSTSLT